MKLKVRRSGFWLIGWCYKKYATYKFVFWGLILLINSMQRPDLKKSVLSIIRQRGLELCISVLETTPINSMPTIGHQYGLTVFPNMQPFLQFETDMKGSRIEIVDSAGRMLQKINVFSNKQQIDIFVLNSGEYILQFFVPKIKLLQKKICIQRR